MYNQVSQLAQTTQMIQVPNNFLMIVLRIVFMIAFAMYALFAFVATRQIQVMSNTLQTPLTPTIKLIGYLHLAVAISMVIFVYMYMQ